LKSPKEKKKSQNVETFSVINLIVMKMLKSDVYILCFMFYNTFYDNYMVCICFIFVVYWIELKWVQPKNRKKKKKKFFFLFHKISKIMK